MSLLIPAALGGAQAAASSANTIKNILAGLVPSLSGIDAISRRNKDIDGFEFDYAGERRLEAGTEITDHYTESNLFMQDHVAVKPTRITLRGFVAETAYNRKSLLPSLLALSSALTPVTPYIGKYSPGASAKMLSVVSQTDAIINQLAQIQGIFGSASKLIGLLPQSTKVQKAYNTLDSLRTGGASFIVVTPWATFGDPKKPRHGPMMIENLIMTEPDDTTGWCDVVVLLKEIRMAPSLTATTLDDARGSQLPAIGGKNSANIVT